MNPRSDRPRLFAHISRKQLKFNVEREIKRQRPLRIKVNVRGKEANIEIVIRECIPVSYGRLLKADLLTNTVLNREKIEICFPSSKWYPAGIVMP